MQVLDRPRVAGTQATLEKMIFDFRKIKMAVAKSNENNQNRKIKCENQKQTLWGVSPTILTKKSFLQETSKKCLF